MAFTFKFRLFTAKVVTRYLNELGISILELLKIFMRPYGHRSVLIMKNKKVYLLLIVFFLSFVILPAINSQITPIGMPLKENHNINLKGSSSYSVQWLKNPNLNSPLEPTWYKTRSGDLSDIDARDGIGQANMTVIGKSGSVQFVAGPGTYSLWKPYLNPEYPLGPWGNDRYGPNPGNGTDSAGFWATHVWPESGSQLGQTPSILWKRNVTMPINMTDYEITAVSLRAIVNGTVRQDVECPGPPIDTMSGGAVSYDYVRFFVTISTLSEQAKFELAYNKTRNLGLGNGGSTAYSSMGDTLMINVPEALMKAYLQQVLTNDHYNFTISLGIFIYCEDNNPTDTDSFIGPGTAPGLRIRSFNLTISYAKKIAQGNAIAWNQKGNQLPKINETTQIIQVDEARLQFKYRSDRNWTKDSLNSELRILMNNQTYPETIKLSKANRTYQDAKLGGFDVTSYIVKNVNISVGIQVYLADAFVLSRNITISIDDAYLWINYTIFDIPPPQPPSINVVADTSTPFTNHWTNLTVTCQSGSANVSRLWYKNPFNNRNITLDTNFKDQRSYNLSFMNQTAGSCLFQFWANSTVGGSAYTSIIIVWVKPQDPTLNLALNSSTPFINQWTQFTVTCQSGSANVSRLWYHNPFNGANITLKTNFDGIKIYYLNFMNETARSYEFRFWANSTLGQDAFKALTVIWVQPNSPILSISANKTNPYTTRWTNITVICQSGSANVSRLWYKNPFNNRNITLDTNFKDQRSYNLYFMNQTAGSYLFQFWANSTLGAPAHETMLIVWILPQIPILSISANTTTPTTDQWSNITVICQSGSEKVDMLWYFNPLDNNTKILAQNFNESRTFHIINITVKAGVYHYKFWANSTLGSPAIQEFIIVWITPQPLPPVLRVSANSSTLYTTQWTDITVNCQSVAGNVDTLWYYNPLTDATTILAMNFGQNKTFHIINKPTASGPYVYKFWANSTLGSLAFQSLTIVWLPPQSPFLSVSANRTSLFINEWVNITVTCQGGSGNVNKLWYYNPLDRNNHTLATDFKERRVFNIININDTADLYKYEFWATSNIGSPVDQAIAILWKSLQPPSLIVIANDTNPFTNQWVKIEVTCVAESGNVDHLWYNENSGKNNIIDTNFSWRRNYTLTFTKSTGGAFTFSFFANSSYAMETTKSVLIIWVDPFPPTVNAFANTTTLYITLWSQVILNCLPGSGTVRNLWWIDPFDNKTKSLATNFTEKKTFYLNFSSLSPTSFNFWFYANDTFGLEDSDYVTIVWILPTPPSLTVKATKVNPFVDERIQIRITCRAGTGPVNTLFYTDPFDGLNKTIATNFAGEQTFYLNFTSNVPGIFTFKVYANSTYGIYVIASATVGWVALPPAPLNVILLIGIFAGIIGAIAAVVGSYFLYFKVPKTIRGIRKLKSNILKGKPMNPLTVSQRGTIADNTFNRVMKESKLPVKKLEVPQELSKFKGKSD